MSRQWLHGIAIAPVGLLALEKLDGIQWVSGAGKPRKANRRWYELYHRILDAGKCLHVTMDAESAKIIHNELRSNRVIYIVQDTSSNVARLVEWLDHPK